MSDKTIREKPLILGKNNRKRISRAADSVHFCELVLRDLNDGTLWYFDLNQDEQLEDLEMHLKAALELVRYVRANPQEGLPQPKGTDDAAQK